MTNFEFIVGIAVGKILFGALFASSIFRNLALGIAAAGVCVIYVHGGVDAVLAIAHGLRADFLVRPDFAKGLVLGAIIAFIAFGLFRRKART